MGAFFLAFRWLPCHCVFIRQKEGVKSLVSLPIRTLIPSDLGSTLMAFFNFDYFLVGPTSKYHHSGDQGSNMSFYRPLKNTLAVSGLSCSTWDLPCIMCELLLLPADFLVAHRLQSMQVSVAVWQHVGSWFPNQGLNLHPLHYKADSQALNHQGSLLNMSF